MKTLACSVVLLMVPGVVASAAAQNALDEARAQYEAAAYEDALATLRRIGDATPETNRIEVEQYRALCLIALGNLVEAERAVATLVHADPMYVPSSNVASPRVLSVVADIRKKQLPAVARKLLDSGRAAFEGKDLVRAAQHFKLLLTLLDDPAMLGRPESLDLRTLAQGFVTLTAAGGSPPASPPAPSPSAPAPSAPGPVATGAAASSPTESAPKPAVAPAAGGTAELIAAVPIEQTLPEWMPPSASVARFEYTGRLRVRIGVDGKVAQAVIERPSHPSYDARLLEVAKNWLYKPATRGGQPIESERIIAIQLRTQP
jgi:hypothetical protein